ncbi:MAG: Maf family protein [Desulfobacteraceae bacterium]|jgi:septum formation protein
MNASPICTACPLILASASPRRKRLLEQAGLPFLTLPAHIPESMDGDDPDTEACNLSRKKARAVLSDRSGSWILGADTVVVLGTTILGKPVDHGDALSMLERLSGREHRVVTGFCILSPAGAEVHTEAVSTSVRFKRLDREEMEGYVNSGEPFGKAGSYAIQGIGAFLVESIEGSYTNVVGLPLCAVIKALLAVGALERFPVPLPSAGDESRKE